jgi:hypothetical protein
MNQPLVFTDRRTHARSRVCKGAKIVFNARSCVLDCTVRNISDVGACLVLATPVVLPPEFELTLDDFITLRYCRVMWHFDTRVGVVF